MMSLIMLGIIPGTNIQISFEAWLLAMLFFTATATAVFTYRRWAAMLPNASKFFRQAGENLRTTVRTA